MPCAPGLPVRRRLDVQYEERNTPVARKGLVECGPIEAKAVRGLWFRCCGFEAYADEPALIAAP